MTSRREARQGPLPPRSRRRGRSLSGSRPPPRPAARRRGQCGARPREAPAEARQIDAGQHFSHHCPIARRSAVPCTPTRTAGITTHHHARDFGWAFAVGIALNLGFVAVETVYGFMANSMALLADAGHNLSDVLGLAVAWAAAILSKRPPTRRFSYGLRASSILAALANAVILLIAVSLHRLQCGVPADHPRPGRRRDGHHRRGDRHRRQRRDRLDVRARPAQRPQRPRRLSAHGRRRSGLGRRGRRGDRDRGDRLAVDRSGDEPRRRRRDRPRQRRHVPRFAHHGAGRRAARDRSGRGRGASARPARRRAHPRPPHLADEHHRIRADRASRHAGRLSRRRLPRRLRARHRPRFRDHPRDLPGRDRRRLRQRGRC